MAFLIVTAKASKRRPRRKGGILPYMVDGGKVKILIVKPGGPLFKGASAGSWSIAKGGARGKETSLKAAKREFTEETGVGLPKGVKLKYLGEKRKYPGLHVWAVNARKVPGAEDAKRMTSNKFKHRGKSYPEIGEHRWVGLKAARRLLDKRMRPYVKDIEAMGLV